MKNIVVIVSFLVCSVLQLTAQKTEVDSILPVKLDEVIVIGKLGLNNRKQEKPLSSIDNYLEKSNRISMIKRGNYAWEPAMNNMVSDRLSVTIDGMQIFGACTDKMDPITSYVDISNLSEVHVNSGQSGTENGATIGGGIDLKLQKSSFEKEELNVGIDLGSESNSNAQIISSEFNYADEKLMFNVDAIYRKAENYVAGGGDEVPFSQYEKFNVSTVAGVKLGKNSAITGSFIFDKANDVGYPALTMDVSLAKALIASVSFEQKNISSIVNKWETKLYYNTITHVMDDTKRPDVPIHMDMPGWSDTYGFYSKIKAAKSKHNLLFNVNGYYNKSLAEMTMYPNDPTENVMFMLTWPDVRTLYSGIYGEDKIILNENRNVKVSARAGFQNASISDDFGLNSLRIFYPDLKDNKSRFLMNFSSEYNLKFKKLEVSIGAGYGQRAPSVTEAYGFYLYNSFDNYDYIGNPYLKNEKSIELNLGAESKINQFKIGTDISFFYLTDYIIGRIAPDIDKMTIGADGVRIYENIENATIFNSNLSMVYRFTNAIKMDGSLGYNLGRDNNGDNLPLISPITYGTSITYKKNTFQTEISMNGADKQHNFSAYYGEDSTSAYTIFNANASYNFYFGGQTLYVKAGVQNLFDRNYSTYTDWKNIPRMGRNVFLNVSYVL
ncbi:TonB-copper family protein [Aureibaculum conchae]|uniref:TonB-dependent receptor n=1 Tax=Aureibaculum sp. 2308TA14-22 TaxID=3108392 RepID=UPI0033910875